MRIEEKKEVCVYLRVCVFVCVCVNTCTTVKYVLILQHDSLYSITILIRFHTIWASLKKLKLSHAYVYWAMSSPYYFHPFFN